jgi:hypothetical protein
MVEGSEENEIAVISISTVSAVMAFEFIEFHFRENVEEHFIRGNAERGQGFAGNEEIFAGFGEHFMDKELAH